MTNSKEIEEILFLYKKNGWILNRVLMSDELRESLSDKELENIFGDTEISDAEFDAVWWTRASQHKNSNAWELRHLSKPPYALFELVDKNAELDVLQQVQNQLENRMRIYASNKGNKK